MKKIFILGLTIFYLFSFGSVNAQEIDIKTSVINKIENTNFILLKFDITGSNSQDIKYVKVRGFRKDSINIYLKNFIEYDCDKYRTIDIQNSGSFIVLIHDKQNVKQFNLKLKAYNHNNEKVYSKNNLFLL
jgi:hypothetical protein